MEKVLEEVSGLPELPSGDASSGAASTVTVSNIGGNCPVQAEGVIDGHSFYFRARGSRWSIEIGGDIDARRPLWEYSESYGVWPDAGWMPEDEALAFIEKGATLFRGSSEAVAALAEGDRSREAK